MKITIVLFVSLATILAISQAEENLKGKGESCTENKECGNFANGQSLGCAEGKCGCKVGQKPQFESHAQGGSSAENGVYVCKKVVGEGCDADIDCNIHLENSKCDDTQHRCLCNKEDGCTDGAVTLRVMSLTTIMAVVVGLLKIW